MSQPFPPDMMSAVMGGGAPQPGMGGGGPMPQDIAALLQGPPPGAEEQGPPLPSEGTPGGGADPLEEAIALLDEAIAAEADQEDQQVMRQCSAKLQQILAKNQKEADASLGGKSTPGGLRKAAASAGYEG